MWDKGAQVPNREQWENLEFSNISKSLPSWTLRGPRVYEGPDICDR